MNRIFQTILAASLVLAAAPGAAHAAPLATTDLVTFETVDSVQFISKETIAVKGIPTGQSQAVEYQFSFYQSVGAEGCLKESILAMERPGRYQLRFEYTGNPGMTCKLIRR